MRVKCFLLLPLSLILVACQNDLLTPNNITISSVKNVNTIKAGESLQLFAKIHPISLSQEVVWSFEREYQEATIDQNGLFTANIDGEYTIIAQAKDYPNIYGDFTITVEQDIFNVFNEFLKNEMGLSTATIPYFGRDPYSYSWGYDITTYTDYTFMYYDGVFEVLYEAIQTAIEETTWFYLGEVENNYYYGVEENSDVTMNIVDAKAHNPNWNGLCMDIRIPRHILTWPSEDVAMMTGIDNIPPLDGADEYFTWNFSSPNDLFAGVDCLGLGAKEVTAYTQALVEASFTLEASQYGYVDPTRQVVVSLVHDQYGVTVNFASLL